ncbi:MAG: methyltransferase domain-containing protein [Gemmataceae bacterium]
MLRPILDLLGRGKRFLALRTRTKRYLPIVVGRLSDLYWDWRCGAWTGGIVESPYADRGASNTESIRYDVLRRVFRQVPIRPDDVLVDVGCGKGRVLSWWLTMGYRNRMIGLELDPRIAARTAARFAGAPNVQIITGDAIENFPPEGTIFWLYNPFHEPIVRAFRDRLKQPGMAEARLIYAHAKHLDTFSQDTDFNCQILDPGWLGTWARPTYLIQFQPRLLTPGFSPEPRP